MRTESLKNITTKIGSGATPTGGERAYKDEGISLIRSQNVLDFQFSKDGLAHIDDEQARLLNNVIVEENDILLNITGDSIARCCVVPNDILPARVNQHVSIIRSDKTINSDYLFYHLQYLKPHLLKICGVGGTRNALTKEAIEKLIINILPNQNEIAEILTALDEKISLNNKINTELEAMAKTIYNYWFVQFDFPTPSPSGRAGVGLPYKTSGGEMVWNEELKREIPKGWEVKRLGKFGEFKNGINYEGDVIGDKVVRIVNVRDISNSTYFILKDELDEISLLEKDSSKYLVHENDILIARSGTPGATRLIYKDIQDVIYCGFIIRFNVEEEKMKKYLFFKLKDIELTLTTKSAGTILKNVSQDTLKELFVVEPEEAVVKSFNEKMNPIFESIYLNSKQNQELIRLRDFLLPLLMNGQVKVK